MAYDSEANIAFDCPGHQGGQFYRKSPAGQIFFKYFGESVFRNDLCNADVDLGDLLIHEGPAAEAQKHAARVFGADRTYFVLNGTSTSNKVVTNAALRTGDLVLFDRNNHKSLHQGALVQAGAIPIFLPTARNAFGMIGAVDWDAWDEASLRKRIAEHPLVKDKARAEAERPFRLACIQLATYDGTIYNVRKVLEKIGHLCDYVLWDEAWIGYNAFHPLFEGHSPMRLEGLGPEMPGLFSTQSVHKQGAGFSQASRSTSATIVLGVAQTLLALMTISPILSEQFSALVNLAVRVVPYIIALSALMMMMRSAGVPEGKFRLNATIATLGMLYSVFAIYASGKDAVLGGMLVTGIGFIIWGFLPPRFATGAGRPRSV